ncbi:MAG: cytochrome c maturation protein CcmE [Armatimonadetes bacterium]|nr:cytochrome c maturation protein CcmE [Armatimonadota bacterium]
MKSYYLIAAVAVVAFVALGASSFLNSMTPYVTTFAEARAAKQDKVQVPGDIVKGKTTYDKKAAALVFYIKDPDGEEMKVSYRGVRPGNFDQADRVVAIGRYGNGEFKAEQLLVKCPSKYQAER